MAVPVACLVVYSGRVQGVGFRYRAVEIARNYRVFGRVRNLSTGQVELHAEGDEKAVNDFLAAVRAAWGTFIRNESVERIPATGEFSTFEITH